MPHAPDSVMPSYSETLVPEREKWQVLVNEALAWLRENGARKVVLARKNILASEDFVGSGSSFSLPGTDERGLFSFLLPAEKRGCFSGAVPGTVVPVVFGAFGLRCHCGDKAPRRQPGAG
jgi:isochorismate synthase EntC